MPLNVFFKRHAIKGKDIYVVDDHHKALAAWALVRRSLNAAPNLITIDHHTDTHEAFLGHAHWEAYEGRVEDQEEFRVGLVARIDWRSDTSVAEAIDNLRHDEHIDAATCCGALGDAFCIQLSDSEATPSVEQLAFEKSRSENWPNPPTVPKPQRPMTYAPAANRIYALPFECFIGCRARPHNDDWPSSRFLRCARKCVSASCLPTAWPLAGWHARRRRIAPPRAKSLPWWTNCCGGRHDSEAATQQQTRGQARRHRRASARESAR